MPVPSVATTMDLPQLFLAADEASVAAQRNLLRRTALRLSLLVLGAAVVLAPMPARVGPALALCCFTLALYFHLRVLQARSGEWWFRGRALAESVKGVSWRYAVGGEPFDVDSSDAGVDRLFLRRLTELRAALPDVVLQPTPGSAITEGMRDLRSRNLAARRRAYLALRVDQQIAWYGERARRNDQLARRWEGAVVMLEMAAVVAAVFAVADLWIPNWEALLTTGAGCLGTWLNLKQHATLARTYSSTMADLILVRERLLAVTSESEWAACVAEAEGLISREHSLWQTARGEASGGGRSS